MKKSIEIKNLKVSGIFNDFNICFYKGINTYICGTSSSGKSALVKCLNNDIKYEGTITKPIISCAYLKTTYKNPTISQEINYSLLNEEQKEFVLSLMPSTMLKNNPNELSLEYKAILEIIKDLHKDFKVIFIDNLLVFLTKREIKLIYAYFKKNKIDIVLISNNIEDALNFKYMIILNKCKVAIEGETKEVLKEEKILKRLGVGLPFYIDLSNKLKLYGLIDKVYLNKKDLKGALWK